MGSEEYEAGLREIEENVKNGIDVRFACYDTFSCFYSRVFLQTVSEGSLKMGIFR